MLLANFPIDAIGPVERLWMKLTFLNTFKYQAPSSEALEMSPIKAQVGSEVILQGTKELSSLQIYF